MRERKSSIAGKAVAATRRVTGSTFTICALALLAGCVGTASPQQPAAAAAPKKPDLVVMVAVDQFGSALFNRWRSRFGAGLARLEREGIVYDNAYQSHGLTETCPGHSTLLTGKTPARTGIVGNSWFDSATGKEVYCLAAPEYSDALDPKGLKVGPTNITASTLGDWLKQASPQSRVVAVSGKDRASITLAGHRADATFWYVDNLGFTTYLAKGEDAAAKLAPVAALNAKIQRDYVPAPDWTYKHEACKAYEGHWRIGSTDWKSTLPPQAPPERPGAAPGKARALQIMDPLTLEAAFTLLDHYQLGRRGVTDLLAVSFSATDFIGHGYGTDGPEMCEQMHLLDTLVGQLLARLDALGVNVVLAFSADHGGTDFPERLAQRGFPEARRVDGGAWLKSVNAEIKAKLGLAHDPLASPDLAQFYAVGADRKRVAEPLHSRIVDAALEVMRRRPEVQAAYPLTELLANYPKDVGPDQLTLRDRFAQNAMAGRSGDILLAYRQGITVATPRVTRFVESHAGPYDLDRQVPIVFWWRGAPAQSRILPITTTDIAPTLAHIAGIGAPADLDGRCLNLANFGIGPCSAPR
jgi:predicted AlkP superfamily pyrophosphatase or phosphodiesterase